MIEHYKVYFIVVDKTTRQSFPLTSFHTDHVPERGEIIKLDKEHHLKIGFIKYTPGNDSEFGFYTCEVSEV